MKEPRLVLEFSGTCVLDPSTRFQYIGEDENEKQFITAAEYCVMEPTKKGLYILEDLVGAMRDSEDLDFCDSSIYEDLDLC